MHTPQRSLVVSVFALFLGLVGSSLTLAKGREHEYHPVIDPTAFRPGVDHPYLPLVPGTRFVYRETAGKRVSENETTVLSETKVIMGVPCTVVHDVLRTGGKVAEETFDWYAQDKQGNVWYFGEDTKEYDGNGHADPEGSWQAGMNGAQPGILMKAQISKSAPYRQEYQRGHAEDMGQIVGLGESITVPAGTYADCIRTKDWSMLEPGHEYKWYAKGVGLVREESATKEVTELVSVTHH